MRAVREWNSRRSVPKRPSSRTTCRPHQGRSTVISSRSRSGTRRRQTERIGSQRNGRRGNDTVSALTTTPRSSRRNSQTQSRPRASASQPGGAFDLRTKYPSPSPATRSDASNTYRFRTLTRLPADVAIAALVMERTTISTLRLPCRPMKQFCRPIPVPLTWSRSEAANATRAALSPYGASALLSRACLGSNPPASIDRDWRRESCHAPDVGDEATDAVGAPSQGYTANPPSIVTMPTPIRQLRTKHLASAAMPIKPLQTSGILSLNQIHACAIC